MKKLLIINPINTRQKNLTGFSFCSNRNIRILTEIYGEDNVDVYDIDFYESKWKAFFFNLCGYTDGLTFSNCKEIKKLSNDYEYLFINSTKLGIILTGVRKQLKTIVFAHNCESIFVEQYVLGMSLLNRILHFPLMYSVKKNERLSIHKASFFLTLNKRDSDAFLSRYNREANFLLPMSYKDSYMEMNNKNLDSDYLLFVGSNFFGNTEGLFWFIENVLEHIPINLKVVGSGMDVYKNKYKTDKVEFLGFVDDLSAMYYNARAVVLPIISGSGMKTKTCEALMYGKYIFGTKEAFEGYDLDFDEVGGLCNNAEEFVYKIAEFLKNSKTQKNQYSRDVFLEGYSDEAVKNNLKIYLGCNNEI